MTRQPTSVPISLRLTIVSVLVMAMFVTLLSAFTYASVSSSLDASINRTLDERWTELGTVGGRLPRGGTSSQLAAQVIGHGDGPTQARDQSTGTLLAATPSLEHVDLLRGHRLPTGSRRARWDAKDKGHTWRVLAGRPVPGYPVALLAIDLHQRRDTLDDLGVQLLTGALVLILLASGVAWLLARRALAPVERLRQQAARLAQADSESLLHEPGGHDEVARLASTLNELLGRLHGTVRRERRFVADAGHELRTPLALLTTELELALEMPRSQSDYEQVLRSLQEETARLSHLAEDLLVLAADERPVPLTPTDVSLLAGDVVERTRSWAQREQRAVELDAAGPAMVEADAGAVERAIQNLVDNALVHGAGTVRVSVEARRDGVVVVRVSDEGAGFPTDFAPRAFQRFARADEARSGGGSGLGLAIVDTIARRHGGAARVRTDAGDGACVEFTIGSESA